jgi:hypothetical protein
MFKSVFLRFVRTFAATLSATVLAQIGAGVTINDLEDLKKFGFSLIVATVAASIVALTKLSDFILKS